LIQFLYIGLNVGSFEMLDFKNIGLFTSSVNSEKIFIARQIEEILRNKGCKVLYDSSFNKKEGKEKYNNLLPFYREEIDKKNFGRSPDL